jgi:hypothetical protein
MRRLPEWVASLATIFGRCKRCTRTSMIAAICAWGVALLALIVLQSPRIAIGAAVPALGLTALWIAHLVGLASRGTLGSMLRELGAKPDEARAIIIALARPVGSDGRDGGRLKEGETISVQRAPRPAEKGFRLTRVVIANEREVTAAVSLSEAGSYIALDPRSVEASTITAGMPRSAA